MKKLLFVVTAMSMMSASLAMAATHPSDSCQKAAWDAAQSEVPAGAYVAETSTMHGPEDESANAVGSVVFVGNQTDEAASPSWSIKVDVRFDGSTRECEVLTVNLLQWAQ